jgi:hypothetical protein
LFQLVIPQLCIFLDCFPHSGGSLFGGTAGSKKAVINKSVATASVATKAPAAPPAARTASAPAVPPTAPVAAAKSKQPHVGHHNQENAVPNSFGHAPAHAEKAHSNGDVDRLQLEIDALHRALEEANQAHHDLKQDFDGLEKERDFYFEKLRDVEILMQEVEDKGDSNELTAAVFKILYATSEGFEQTVDETGAGSTIPATPHKTAPYVSEVTEGETY